MREWWRSARPRISARTFNALVRVRHSELLSRSQESARPATQLAVQQHRLRAAPDASPDLDLAPGQRHGTPSNPPGAASCGPSCDRSCMLSQVGDLSAPEEDMVVSASVLSQENGWDAPATPALDPADRWGATAPISAPLSAQQLVFQDLKGMGKGKGRGSGKGTSKDKGKGTDGPDSDDDDDDDDAPAQPAQQQNENGPRKGDSAGESKGKNGAEKGNFNGSVDRAEKGTGKGKQR